MNRNPALPVLSKASLTTLQSVSRPLAVGVSGGSDSVALVVLLKDALPNHALHVLTVHHHLREAADAEIAHVQQLCQNLDLPHSVLHWNHESVPVSNIQHQARDARYRLMSDYCKAHGIHDLLVAHTKDDQAETVLMRLLRGSGVSGLTAMHTIQPRYGIRLHRPLLGATRQALRDKLVARGITWVDDPTNQDTAYERVRIRQLLTKLDDYEQVISRLSLTARQLQRSRDFIDGHLQQAMNSLCNYHDAGYITIDIEGFHALHEELGLRLLSRVLHIVGEEVYPPRFEKLEGVYQAMLTSSFATRTLAKCCIIQNRKTQRYIICKEAAYAKPPDQWGGGFHIAFEAEYTSAYRFDIVGEAGYSCLPKACLQRFPEWMPYHLRVVLPAIYRVSDKNALEKIVAIPHISYECDEHAPTVHCAWQCE